MEWWDILSTTIRAGIGQTAIAYVLAAIGLNLHFGYTGLLNFGQVGFMAAGAYGVGIASGVHDIPLPFGILIGLGAGVVLALLLGAPTLRLRADYLAIVTIAVGEIVRLVVRAGKFKSQTGGSSGIPNPADDFQSRWSFLGLTDNYGWVIFDRINLRFNGRDLWILIVGWGLIVVCVGLMWLLVSSPWGRVLRAIREDEDAARALGKNVFRFKMQSLVLGGTFGSLGGMFIAISQNSVQPDNFSTPVTFFALTAAIIGGFAKVWGPVIGTVVFWMIVASTENVLRQAVANDHMPDWLISGTQVGQVRYILTGLLLMLLMVYRPQGIFGDRREIAIDARK